MAPSAPPRDDFDKNKAMCQVFDCVFHPDTLRMAKTNAAFKQMINSTAFDSITEKFGVSLDRANVKTPKMDYKGLPNNQSNDSSIHVRKCNDENNKSRTRTIRTKLTTLAFD